MNLLITEKYSALAGNYLPYIRENVSDEIASQLIDWQKDKIPIDGFYRHRLETANGNFTWYSACADVTGYVTSLRLPPKEGEKKEEEKK